MANNYLNSFLKYLSAHKKDQGSRLPSLSELSRITQTSVPSLREQLEAARALGFVEVRPKTGIRKLNYQFAPAVIVSLEYAMAENPVLFDKYADLRKHIESAYFEEAASILTREDIIALESIIFLAKKKLDEKPVEIPFTEHRDFHLLMYSRLDNPFVTGLLEAYWNIYEEVGLNRFYDLSYHQRVWEYHQGIVDTIRAGEFSSSKKTLLEHMILLQQRDKAVKSENLY